MKSRRFGRQFAYNDAGHVTKIVDPGGRKTAISYELDKTGRFVKQVTRKHPDDTSVT